MAEILNAKKIIERLEESVTQLEELNSFMNMLTDDGRRLKKTYEVEELSKLQPINILRMMPIVMDGTNLQARIERFIDAAPPMIIDEIDFV